MPSRAENVTYKGLMTEAINRVRKKHGLAPLGRVAFLDEIAREHSRNMARYKNFSHFGFDGRASKIKAKMGNSYIAENCYMYPAKKYDKHVVEKIVDGWMKSKGHRENILNSQFGRTGIGWVVNHGYVYATQIFVEGGSSDQPLHRPIKIKAFRFKMPFKLRVLSFKHRKAKGGEGMLRLPVKVILMSASIASIILGAHGLYAYFHPLETLFALGMEAYDKLFFALELPVSGLQTIVGWMSLKGIQSWFIPAVFVIMGIVFWVLNQRIRGGSTILRKLHLW